jgi:hypothetical protein
MIKFIRNLSEHFKHQEVQAQITSDQLRQQSDQFDSMAKKIDSIEEMTIANGADIIAIGEDMKSLMNVMQKHTELLELQADQLRVIIALMQRACLHLAKE